MAVSSSNPNGEIHILYIIVFQQHFQPWVIHITSPSYPIDKSSVVHLYLYFPSQKDLRCSKQYLWKVKNYEKIKKRNLITRTKFSPPLRIFWLAKCRSIFFKCLFTWFLFCNGTERSLKRLYSLKRSMNHFSI